MKMDKNKPLSYFLFLTRVRLASQSQAEMGQGRGPCRREASDAFYCRTQAAPKRRLCPMRGGRAACAEEPNLERSQGLRQE